MTVLVENIDTKIPLRYIKGYREYYIKNKWLPSVTSILPEPSYLSGWRETVGPVEAERIRNETARIGELAHFHIIESLKNDLGSIKPVYQDIPDFVFNLKDKLSLYVYNNYVELTHFLYQKFLEEYASKHKFKLIDGEFLCYNTKVGYAGRCDLLFYLDDVVCMGDIKTSSHIRNEYKMQLAAYQHGLLSPRYVPEQFFIFQFHPYIDELDILKLKNGYTEPFYEIHEVEPDWQGFLEAKHQFDNA